MEKRMKVRIAEFLVIGAIALINSPAFAIDWLPASRTIAEVMVAPEAYYVTATSVNGSSAWGFPGCPTQLYVRINRTEPDARELLSLLLSAKAGGRPIAFSGVCLTPTSWIDTNYIIMY
jgi:hypothetical protein